MIDPKELRIGNRINYNLPEINRCKAYDGTFNEEFARYLYDVKDEWQYLEPIHITREILEKCGFTWSDDGWLEKHLGYCRWVLRFYGGYNDKCSIFQYPLPGEPHLPPQKISFGTNCPSYVHDLQNLFFALTGEELEIKL